MIYRIKYGRYEGVKYISHLDILKLFDRATRRADLPVAYSEGFNPHPKFVFGMPIPVGTTSESEYVDITFTEDIKKEDVLNKLNDALPPSVRILEINEITEQTPNIMKNMAAAKYRIKADFEEGEIEKIVARAHEKDELVVEKKSKSGTKMVDIRPMIFFAKKEEDALILTIAAGNEVTLRADLAVTTLAGRDLKIKSIHRLALLTKDEIK